MVSQNIQNVQEGTNMLNFISKVIYPVLTGVIVGILVFLILTLLRKNKKIKLSNTKSLIISIITMLVVTFFLMLSWAHVFPVYFGY